MFNKMKVRKRLTTGFILVALIASVSGIAGLVSMSIISARYDNALTNFGFAQGDIGMAMTAFADSRSSMRAAIGYTDADIIQSMKEGYANNKATFESYFEAIGSTMVTQDGKNAYAAAEDALVGYWELAQEVLDEGSTTDPAASAHAQMKLFTEVSPHYDRVYAALTHLMDVNVEKGDATQAQLAALQVTITLLIIVAIVVAFAASTVLGRSLAGNIEKPLHALQKRFKDFAQGDLDSPFPVSESQDEIAEMVEEAKAMAETLNLIVADLSRFMEEMAKGNFALNTTIEEKYVGEFRNLLLAIRQMNRQMNTTLQQVEDAAQQVSTGSENLAQSATALAEGATEQAGAVEELTATITNIAESVEKTAHDLEEANVSATAYAKKADQSREEMEALVSTMGRINETSQKIENIISDIESIASQTNLLSLNAAIEAARAGEAGKGFAVVADQIRQLAEQSAKSAVDTRVLIEGALQEIAQGNTVAQQASVALEEVVDGIKDIAASSESLSMQSADQANAMEQASAGVNQISEVVQANSAAAEESSATSEELSAQAISLGELVQQFTLRRD